MKSIFKRIICLLLVLVMCCGMLAACGGSSKKYTCKHCGTKMEAYWSYHNGYVCYSCNKKYYK